NKPEPEWKVERFSQHFACDRCGRSFEPLNPHHFSFNSPLGWCPTCEGLGSQRGANPAVLIRDPRKSLRDGAIAAWPPLTKENRFLRFAEAIARHVGFSLDSPYEELEPSQQRAVLHGTGDAWIPLEPTAPTASEEPQKKSRRPRSRAEATGLRFQYKG